MRGMEIVEILRACCCVAGIDGETSDQERETLQNLASKVGVGKASLDAMIDRGNSDPAFQNDQFRILKTDPQSTMLTLFRTAMADGVITDGEISVLSNFSKKLDVSETDFQAYLQAARSELEK